VYGIVRQSGGFVDVQSTPNAGTTFRIFLPINAGDAGASNANAGVASRLSAAAPTA
jgi:two-component system cell cycle sensor histidine kinase/response regulator CckA